MFDYFEISYHSFSFEPKPQAKKYQSKIKGNSRNHLLPKISFLKSSGAGFFFSVNYQQLAKHI
jgi:hypothetical protein